MAIEYASKYSPKVDEKFSQAAFTNGMVNSNYEWEGVSTVKVYGVGTAALGDYSLTGTSRYGTPSDLSNTVQSLTVAKDRAFTYVVDRKSYDDTQMTMEVGASLAREIREVVVPEVDKYRITAAVAGAAAANIVTLAVTITNAYAEFLNVNEKLDDALVPVVGRIAYVKPNYYNKLKQDDSFTKTADMATKIAMSGLVGEVDGVLIVKVASQYFADNVDFIITHPLAMVSPVKLVEFKIHTQPQGVSGWLVEGRIRYDAFVLTNKQKAIGIHKNAADA